MRMGSMTHQKSSSRMKWWQRAHLAERSYEKYLSEETNLMCRFPSSSPSREKMRKDIFNLIITIYFSEISFSPGKHVGSFLFSPGMKSNFAWPANIPFLPVHRKIVVEQETVRKARMHELKKMRTYLLKRYETMVRKQLWQDI